MDPDSWNSSRKRRRACCIYRLYLGIAEMAHILTIFYVYRNNFDREQKKGEKKHSFTIQQKDGRRHLICDINFSAALLQHNNPRWLVIQQSYFLFLFFFIFCVMIKAKMVSIIPIVFLRFRPFIIFYFAKFLVFLFSGVIIITVW